MSVNNPETEDALDEIRGFFIEAEQDWEDQESVDHQRLVLQRADTHASQNHLKDAIDAFSMALRYGSVKPEQLGALVDCILRNFKKKLDREETPSTGLVDGSRDSPGVGFNCPGCSGFLGEPVTVSCGHSYCKRCLQLELFSKCKLCGENFGARGPGEHKPTVILCGLLEKWFPNETKTSKAVGEMEDLNRRKRFDEAVSLATSLIQSEPSDVLARLSRAEAYTGLQQYQLALEDMEACLCLRPTRCAESYFQKAKILQEMGQVDDSLQVYLQCLSVDEDFRLARRQVEVILLDLLSPAGDSVKEGLRETAQSTSPHLRRKNQPEAQSHPAETRTASAHPNPELQERPGRSESLERPGLSRAHSLRTHLPGGPGEEGLKRVSSAPQLGDQDKGALLKRKLSCSEAGGPNVVPSGKNKHKKQGATLGVSGRCTAPARPQRNVPPELVDPIDFECSLCMRLFYEPVTTPCGHTFCKNCLERCLDHTPQCPLCKESLKEYLATRKYTITNVLDRVLRYYLSNEHAERQKAHLEEGKELSNLTQSVPVFVCTMAYPTVPCPLHVFEPRYRLMIRRCMESGTRQFGMCINDSEKGFVDHGCMLIIRSVHFLPDGRSVVDTVGGKRFRVLSRGVKDGYATANIQYLEDERVNNARELSKLQELHDRVYEQARTWFQNLKNRFRNQILQHFGPMPEREDDIQATANGPACCWWLLAVLPVDPRYQLSVLSLTSLRERLLKMQNILAYLQSLPSE